MAMSQTALKQRFESKVDSSGEHHVWTGLRDPGRGTGRAKYRGKDITAVRLAWTLYVGDVPRGAKVQGCPDEPACVRVEHLSLVGDGVRKPGTRKPTTIRMPKGGGSIQEVRTGVFKLTVTAGAHEDGRQRRMVRTIEGDRHHATKLIAAMVEEIGDGSKIPLPEMKDLTVNDLLRMYLDSCTEQSVDNPKALAHSTLVRYEDIRKNWVGPALGVIRLRALSEADIDRLFAVMRNDGKSYSHMNQAKALLNGALRWARRRKMIAKNPMAEFELPRSKHIKREVVPPEIDELIKLLNDANQHDMVLAPVLALAATTGMRRGELSGLRRDRVDLANARLRVDNAVNDAGGVIVEKTTKTHQARWLSLDPATCEMLRAHMTSMDARAEVFGVSVDPGCFVFSLEPDCSGPMRPEFMTRRMRVLRNRLGLANESFETSILALRKFTTTELMDAGFNPSAVSGRQGHTVQVMLAHYSKRRKSADEAAAAHLGERVYGTHRTTSEM